MLRHLFLFTTTCEKDIFCKKKNNIFEKRKAKQTFANPPDLGVDCRYFVASIYKLCAILNERIN